MLELIAMDCKLPIKNTCPRCRNVHEESRFAIKIDADGRCGWMLNDRIFECLHCLTQGVGVLLFENLPEAVRYAEHISDTADKEEVTVTMLYNYAAVRIRLGPPADISLHE